MNEKWWQRYILRFLGGFTILLGLAFAYAFSLMVGMVWTVNSGRAGEIWLDFKFGALTIIAVVVVGYLCGHGLELLSGRKGN